MNNVRTMAIVDYVREHKYCSTTELMRAFEVSTATIRRDIAEIVRGNHLRKVHGGLAALDAPAVAVAPARNDPFAERVQTNADAKARLARQAETMIANGDILFLDSSTTALFLARQLQNSPLANLTIVTNSVSIIQEFRLFPPPFVLVAVGGSYNPQLNAFLGKAAVESLRRLQIDRAFLSAAGLTKDGLFTYHESHAEFLHAVRATAREVHVLLDRSKFNKSALFPICALDRLESLLTDAAPPDEIGQGLPRCLVAPP
ncbi:MAG: DeoR/GlpR transcriptional regulator [Verrucomicrobia bacterium]|nr:DeoR/GlpR transcriptional regulator [Verrucomicrobiota bacterium]